MEQLDSSLEPAVSIETNEDGTVTYTPEGGYTAVVLLIHGNTGCGENMRKFADAWSVLMPHAKFIMPTAGLRPIVTGHQVGRLAHSWCDVGPQVAVPGAGLSDARDRMLELLLEEHSNNIPYNRMLIMGFSQGTLVTLFTGLQMPEQEMKLAGLVVVSGAFPFHRIKLDVNPAHKKIPVFIAHAKDDDMVKPMAARGVRNRLWWKGVTNVSLRWYSGGHAQRNNPGLIRDAGAFIATQLPPA